MPEYESRERIPGGRRPRAAASTFNLTTAWWPVALGSEVTTTPRRFRLGDRELALYRDNHAAVRAVADLCPHRRTPLSLGRVTEDGYIQCVYHGWCFDGATGQCVLIPNLREDEKVSPSIRVTAYATAEAVAGRLGMRLRRSLAPAVGEPSLDVPADRPLTRFDTVLADGFVHVWTGSIAPASGPLPDEPVDGEPDGPSTSGAVEVRAPWSRLAEALLWNPGRVLGLGPLLGEGDELIDVEVALDGDAVIADRTRLVLALPRPQTFEFPTHRCVRSRIATSTLTGLTVIDAEEEGGRWSARVVAGLAPISDYRTMLRWRVDVTGRRPGVLVAASRVIRRARQLRTRTNAAEQVADHMDIVADGAVERLRQLLRGDQDEAVPH